MAPSSAVPRADTHRGRFAAHSPASPTLGPCSKRRSISTLDECPGFGLQRSALWAPAFTS